jgi:hypothetical protein
MADPVSEAPTRVGSEEENNQKNNKTMPLLSKRPILFFTKSHGHMYRVTQSTKNYTLSLLKYSTLCNCPKSNFFNFDSYANI